MNNATAFENCGDFLLQEIFLHCDLLRDGHVLSRVCRRFYGLVCALLGRKPRLPCPGSVAFSRPLLRYVKAEGTDLKPHPLTVYEARDILARDDVESCRNLVAEGYSLKSLYVTDAVHLNAPACLDFLIGIRESVVTDRRELRQEALQLPTLDCDAVLARRGFKLPENPETYAIKAGPDRFCALLGLTKKEALARENLWPQLAAAAVHVDDAETLERCLAGVASIEELWRSIAHAGSPRCAELLTAYFRPDAELFGHLMFSGLFTEATEKNACAVAEFLMVLLTAGKDGHAHTIEDFFETVRRGPYNNGKCDVDYWYSKLLRLAIKARSNGILAHIPSDWLQDRTQEAIMSCSNAARARFVADAGLLPPRLPKRLFRHEERHPEVVVEAWQSAGGVWYPELCALLAQNGHASAWYFAFKHGCPCIHVGGTRIVGNAGLRDFGCVRAAKTGDPRVLEAELRRNPRLTAAALAAILKSDRADLLAVALNCGCTLPRNIKARAGAARAKRCYRLLELQ